MRRLRALPRAIPGVGRAAHDAVRTLLPQALRRPLVRSPSLSREAVPTLQEARRLVGAGRQLRARGRGGGTQCRARCSAAGRRQRRRRRRWRWWRRGNSRGRWRWWGRGDSRGCSGGGPWPGSGRGGGEGGRLAPPLERGRAAAGVRCGGSAGRDAGRACASSTLGPSLGPLGRRPWLVGALKRSLHRCCCLAGGAAATSAATAAARGVRRGGASLRLCPAQPSRVAGTRRGGHPAGRDRISLVVTEARASSTCSSAPRRRRPSRSFSLARYVCTLC